MSYMWNEFNIKTFPAETIVYRDGAYCADLSTIPDGPINKNYDLPVHIIYIGEIAGKCRLDVENSAENQKIIISVNVKIKSPAFLNIFIKNAGKNSEICGTILMQNNSELTYDCVAEHQNKNTAIMVKNKLLAEKDSVSKLSGTTIIKPDCPDCESDMAFSAMADNGAKIEFMPAQEISSEPKSADHSAAIFKPTDAQIFFLRGAGLSGAEVDIVTKEAFLSE